LRSHRVRLVAAISYCLLSPTVWNCWPFFGITIWSVLNLDYIQGYISKLAPTGQHGPHPALRVIPCTGEVKLPLMKNLFYTILPMDMLLVLVTSMQRAILFSSTRDQNRRCKAVSVPAYAQGVAPGRTDTRVNADKNMQKRATTQEREQNARPGFHWRAPHGALAFAVWRTATLLPRSVARSKAGRERSELSKAMRVVGNGRSRDSRAKQAA
jgi:hypothetical protein